MYSELQPFFIHGARTKCDAGHPSCRVSEALIKYKDKGHPVKDHEGPNGVKRYSSTLSLTSALDGVGG